jgi:hypothetical protein
MLAFCKTFPAAVQRHMYLLEIQAHPLYVNIFELAQVLERETWLDASWQFPSLLFRMLVKRHNESGRGRMAPAYEKVLCLGRVLQS